MNNEWCLLNWACLLTSWALLLKYSRIRFLSMISMALYVCLYALTTHKSKAGGQDFKTYTTNTRQVH